jgi:hypothetical protein
MKRPLVNTLILILLLAGLLMVDEGVSQAVQNSNDGIGHYFTSDPNEPEPEAALDCQTINPLASLGQVLNEDSEDEADDEGDDDADDEGDEDSE